LQNGDENDENGLSGNSSNTLCAPNQGCRELQIGLENLCEEEGVEQYCGEGLLSLGEREADGGGERRRVGGTGAAWAREWLRSSGAGAACASVGERVRWRSEELGRGGGLEWRAGGARAAAERRTGTGAGRQFREREEQQ